jgi:putative YhdH/YhfP family quinone oxidoreductase
VKKETFKAFVVEETGKNEFSSEIKELTTADLPAGDVLVRVEYSSLNYKDALSATGNRGVTRNYPHTPGIDAAGVVAESATDDVKEGDSVIVTSYDLGMNTSGGYGQYIRVPADWVVNLPAGMTLEESMIYGTAGFTAGMSVGKLTPAVKPDDGQILVTGATGGVGSMAVGILAKLGYSVAAVSGKADAEEMLTTLGADEIIDRQAFLEGSDRPLLKTRWAGVIDTVGGEILAAAVKSTLPLGVVTCCGNVASVDLPLNVFPFILRGVSLIGIDSQNCPMPFRRHVWEKLASEWKFPALDNIYREIELAGLPSEIDKILKGGQKGRVVVRVPS